MFFTDKKRKKNLIFSLLALFIFSGVIFVFSDVHTVSALDKGGRVDCQDSSGSLWDCIKGNAGTFGKELGNTALWPFKAIVYAIFVVFGWVGSLALSIFEWAIDPADVTLLFDSPGVYESWKFVRDFFNLFFILVLLYIAFTVVFQINKDFKKAILSLVLAALFINFSFPVSRALIDATNVPMYFFANQMMARNAGQGTGVFGGVLTASHLKEILIPDKTSLQETDFSRLIMATIFMFLFSVTLLVLSIMFVIRLVVLVMLVIFSAVGFAASIIPGMDNYAKQWWENFWKYALFGPAAMLMLLVATRFFASIGGVNSELTKSVNLVTQGTVTAPEQTFFSGMVLFTIPIIMLWVAMGLAQKMSIAGADSVVGLGQKVAKWVGARASGYHYIPDMAKWTERNVLGKRFSPRAIIAGWKAKTADAEAKFLGPATGYWHNNFNKIFRQAGADREMLEKSRVVAKRQKEIEETSEESEVLLGMAGKLVGKKGAQPQTDLQAIFRTLIHNNDHDELMEWIHENVEKDTDLGKKFKGMGFTEDNSTVGGENTARAIDILLDKSGLGETDRLKHLNDLGTIATEKGGIMFGATSVDSDGKYHKNYTQPGKMAALTAAKIMTTPDAQNIPKTMHRNHFTNQHGGLNSGGKSLLLNYASPSAIEQIARHKPDFHKKVGGDRGIMQQAYKFAKELQTGEAEVFDLHSDALIKLKNEEQAIAAAAWTAALQAKAGISQAEIESQISVAGFDAADMKEILEKSKGPQKPDTGKIGSKPRVKAGPQPGDRVIGSIVIPSGAKTAGAASAEEDETAARARDD
ncbi:MAG: hypothetical protein Q8Q10_03075 [bacterium]|nr:hypothetical protein [bacterium]